MGYLRSGRFTPAPEAHSHQCLFCLTFDTRRSWHGDYHCNLVLRVLQAPKFSHQGLSRQAAITSHASNAVLRTIPHAAILRRCIPNLH